MAIFQLSSNTALLLLVVTAVTTHANSPPSFVAIPGTNPTKYYNMDRDRYSEDTPVGPVIYTLIASDPDNDAIVFGIQTGSDYFGVASQNNTHARINLVKPLDYETATQHQIIWTLNDGNNIPVETDITIYVVDVNDNAPLFIGAPYTVAVTENEHAGTTVLSFNVTDIDSGANGRITLSMTEKNSTGDVFSLSQHVSSDGRTILADIIMLMKLNFEARVLYELLIVVKDDGKDTQLTSTTTATINVVDVQDEPPYWIGEPYIALVYDTTPVNTSIITVFATDGDESQKRPVEYEFVDDSSSNSSVNDFSINTLTGEIFLVRQLSNNSLGERRLKIMANEIDESQDSNDTSSTTYVEITILPGAPEHDETSDDISAFVATAITILIVGVIAVVVMALCVYHAKENV
ncbi:cadherin-related family member 1-like [Saccoglossus kowalevskii]|uniref:Cadherin-related family member 1-like n=1 Tax=Saccoglossus kowalevskii TaxID=10224 RepID=A0ABM0M381_SACKO|nr:PREDICTED: cadherin-related family member 1-like [Saccoglossus kowalevskii]